MRFVFFSLLIIFSGSLFAQDTLPRFNVVNPGNGTIIVSWTNNYDIVRQISVQTSHDSLKNYRTIMSMADPNTKQNGYADANALNDHMYYRLFVLLGDGQYFFTEAKQPVLDTTGQAIVPVEKPTNQNFVDFIPSFYVYTNREGYVYVNLPDADRRKYHIKFYEEDNDFLFELKNINETGLTLDKTNFIHGGWFRFELYNGDRLVEKNKFYLAKDF
ncbi:MAG: hypothetical protein ACO1OO_10705 [Flavisolibacter sp.]